MFERLTQPLRGSKKKTKELPKREARTAVAESKTPQPGSANSRRLFGLQFGRSKQPAKELPQRATRVSLVETKASQPGSADSLRSLLKTAIADAEQIADSIKMRAQAEAEAEATRIIAQAKLEVDEIKGRAAIVAQREAEKILSEANRKAEITEIEAKQKALQFLIRASGEIEKEIKEEYQGTYSRLSSSLQDLMNEGQKIEIELKNRVANLLQSQGLELKGVETMLLSTAEATVPPGEASAPAETELKPDVSGMEKPQEPEMEVLKDVAKKAGVEPKKARSILRKLVARGEDQKKARWQFKPNEINSVVSKIKGAKTEKAEALEEKVAEPVKLEAEAVEEKVAEPVQLEAKAVEEKRETVLGDLDRQGLYTGEVELLIVPPVELKLVSRLYNYLQTVPELRILYTRGSWDQGTTIIVVLENPLPLINIILATPDVKVTPELLDKEGAAAGKSSSLLRGGGQKVQKIMLTLKET